MFVPKGMASDVQAVIGARMANIAEGDLQLPPVHPLNVQEIAAERSVLEGARHAYWVTWPSGDGRGAVRAINVATGEPVVLKDGRPLQYSFSRIPDLAAQVRAGSLTGQVQNLVGQAARAGAALVGAH